MRTKVVLGSSNLVAISALTSGRQSALLTLLSNPKLVDPLTRLYLRDQPARLLATARPRFGRSVGVLVFR
jgi:hypothetical protein